MHGSSIPTLGQYLESCWHFICDDEPFRSDNLRFNLKQLRGEDDEALIPIAPDFAISQLDCRHEFVIEPLRWLVEPAAAA